MINKNNLVNENIILKMIELNSIENLLKFKIYKNNIEFNIDGKISLEQKFRGQVDYKFFLDIFLKILNALCRLEKYMITTRNIYLTKKDIYLDQNNNVYFKIEPYTELSNDIKNLYQNHLIDLNFNLKDNLSNLFKINTYLNSEFYTINGFKNFLIEIIDDNDKKKEGINSIKIPKKQNKIIELINKYKKDKKI